MCRRMEHSLFLEKKKENNVSMKMVILPALSFFFAVLILRCIFDGGLAESMGVSEQNMRTIQN